MALFNNNDKRIISMKEIFWVARDGDGTLCAYRLKPWRTHITDDWQFNPAAKGSYVELPQQWFPDLSMFDDPILVRLKPEKI